MKKGRKPIPKELKCVNTSIRLRPDRKLAYKRLGGIKFLNAVLDEHINNEIQTG